jgi:hypothetical protein
VIKTLFACAIALGCAIPAHADEHGRGRWHGGGNNWIAPFVGGAIVGGLLGGGYYGSPYYAPAPYYTPVPHQPYYHWDCNPYGQCGWIWH